MFVRLPGHVPCLLARARCSRAASRACSASVKASLAASNAASTRFMAAWASVSASSAAVSPAVQFRQLPDCLAALPRSARHATILPLAVAPPARTLERRSLCRPAALTARAMPEARPEARGKPSDRHYQEDGGRSRATRAGDDGTTMAGLRWLCTASRAGMTVSTCNATEKKVGVFEAGDIREWRGHDVVDSGGHKIGELEAVYVDTSTDLPAFATVKVGLPTRHRLVFVPLAQATVGPGYLKVAHDRKQVKDSPSISTDGELPSAGEEAIFKHYGLTYQAGTSGERQLARR
jgi:PRC-barrel domain protein